MRWRSEEDALILEFGMVPEVDEEAEFATGGVEVVQYLSAVLVNERRHGFEFYENVAEADQVRGIALFERATFVGKADLFLRFEGDASEHQLNLQALLVDCFEEPTALFLVHFEAGSDDVVALFFVDDLAHE
jgi:hypothetical protein